MPLSFSTNVCVCIKTPLFPGESDLDQLDKIFQLFGTPTEDIWPVRKLLRIREHAVLAVGANNVVR